MSVVGVTTGPSRRRRDKQEFIIRAFVKLHLYTYLKWYSTQINESSLIFNLTLMPSLM